MGSVGVTLQELMSLGLVWHNPGTYERINGQYNGTYAYALMWALQSYRLLK